MTNPLGFKTKIHKLEKLYYTFQNLRHQFNSLLSNIYLLAIINSCDTKGYGFAKILKTFMKELAQLESKTGMRVDKNEFVPGAVTSNVGNTMAAHMLLGF